MVQKLVPGPQETQAQWNRGDKEHRTHAEDELKAANKQHKGKLSFAAYRQAQDPMFLGMIPTFPRPTYYGRSYGNDSSNIQGILNKTAYWRRVYYRPDNMFEDETSTAAVPGEVEATMEKQALSQDEPKRKASDGTGRRPSTATGTRADQRRNALRPLSATHAEAAGLRDTVPAEVTAVGGSDDGSDVASLTGGSRSSDGGGSSSGISSSRSCTALPHEVRPMCAFLNDPMEEKLRRGLLRAPVLTRQRSKRPKSATPHGNASQAMMRLPTPQRSNMARAATPLGNSGAGGIAKRPASAGSWRPGASKGAGMTVERFTGLTSQRPASERPASSGSRAGRPSSAVSQRRPASEPECVEGGGTRESVTALPAAGDAEMMGGVVQSNERPPSAAAESEQLRPSSSAASQCSGCAAGGYAKIRKTVENDVLYHGKPKVQLKSRYEPLSFFNTLEDKYAFSVGEGRRIFNYDKLGHRSSKSELTFIIANGLRKDRDTVVFVPDSDAKAVA